MKNKNFDLIKLMSGKLGFEVKLSDTFGELQEKKDRQLVLFNLDAANEANYYGVSQ
tara:strand:- start:24 stop:191 length:168 start_codon:yes stop_codon:yes gene_type:complete